jgi:hypothetical protein
MTGAVKTVMRPAVRKRARHGARPVECPKPYARMAENIVAIPLVEYHAATLIGCSDRRYH